MKRNLAIVSTAVFILVLFLTNSLTLQSHILRPLEGGLAGDPGQESCVHCHEFGAFTDPTRFILHISKDSAGLSNANTIITGTTQYTPHDTQWLSIEFMGANGNTPVYGFQITALQSTNDSMAGFFTLANTSNTSIENSNTSFDPGMGTRSYVGHAHASSNKVWSFKWTAPDTGNVTFYYSGNFGNGDGTSNGDSIYHGSFTLSAGPFSTGISDISGGLSAFRAYPVPFSGSLQTEMTLDRSAMLDITLISMEGRVVKQLYSGHAAQGRFSRSFEAGDIAEGVYFLRVRSGSSSQMIKIMKL